MITHGRLEGTPHCWLLGFYLEPGFSCERTAGIIVHQLPISWVKGSGWSFILISFSHLLPCVCSIFKIRKTPLAQKGALSPCGVLACLTIRHPWASEQAVAFTPSSSPLPPECTHGPWDSLLLKYRLLPLYGAPLASGTWLLNGHTSALVILQSAGSGRLVFEQRCKHLCGGGNVL